MIKHVNYTLLLLALLVAPAKADIIFHQDWEDGTGSSSQGFYPSPDQYAGSWSLTSSADEARSNNRSLKFLVNKGDFNVGERIRCTMTSTPGGSINGKSILPYDKDRWFGFSVWNRKESNMQSRGIVNFHAQNWGTGCYIDAGGTPLYLRMEGPGETGGGYEMVLGSNTDYNGASGETLWREDVSDEMEQWIDIVLHVKFSFGTGVVQLWKNGKLVYNNSAFTLKGYPVPQSCGNLYPKISAGSVSPYMPILAYQDSHRWGDEKSSFQEVDPAQNEFIPPPPDDPAVTGDRIEAETGKILGIMETIQDSSASGGSYIRTMGSGEGTAEFTVTTENAGLYNILARVYAWSDINDTFFVSVDGGQEQSWDLNIEYQEWIDVTSQFTVTLSKGTHTIRFRGENDSARLDNFSIEIVQLQYLSPPAGFQLVK